MMFWGAVLALQFETCDRWPSEARHIFEAAITLFSAQIAEEKALLSTCFFATDLHGSVERYEKLLRAVMDERPSAVFLGGDLLPRDTLASVITRIGQGTYVQDYLIPLFRCTRADMGSDYPEVFLILGNDDPRRHEESFRDASEQGLWHYSHQQKIQLGRFSIYGYACVPPTPFSLKDWECYDVSRYVPPGSISPEEGHRSVPAEESSIKWGTIEQDLILLANEDALDRAVFLFHTPPYDTPLDRAALDGQAFEYVPLDVHIGSIAVRRFIEERQPLLTLHGHVHEAARLTGEWKVQLGRTVCINGAHDGPELALVRIDLNSPAEATRELL